MQLRDPTRDVEPNFEDAVWAVAREAIMAGGKSPEEALDILKEGWRTQHERDLEAWEERLRQQQQGAEQGGEEEPAQQDPPDIEQQTESETPEWVNKPTPSFLDIRPARHILKRLEKKEFVELWYFTAEGCQDTAAADLTTPDDTFGLVNSDKGLLFQSIGASTTPSKVIKDEHLSWNQLTEAKTRMVGCLGACGWSEHEVSQLARFYLSLDVHPIRSHPYGLESIMRYQDRVRRDWVAHLRSGDPYSIAKVNDDLMKEFRDEIRNEIQAKNNVSYPVSEVLLCNTDLVCSIRLSPR